MAQYKLVIGGFAILILASCASAPAPVIPPAVTEITGKTCADKVSIANAIALSPTKKRADHYVSTNVDAAQACVNIDGKPANYVVYALPDFPDNHTITIGGIQELLRTFAPIVSLLDKDGNQTRTIGEDKMAILGNSFGVSLRPATTDKFILVTSNPKLVGTAITTHETRVAVSTNYAYNPYGGSTYNTYRGVEGTANRTYSHEGTIGVTIQAIKGKIGLPEEK